MGVKDLESKVLALPLAKRRAFTRWLDENRDRIEETSKLARAQQREVLRRLGEMETDPAMRIPFREADVEKMLREMIHERRAKTSARSR